MTEFNDRLEQGRLGHEAIRNGIDDMDHEWKLGVEMRRRNHIVHSLGERSLPILTVADRGFIPKGQGYNHVGRQAGKHVIENDRLLLAAKFLL